MTDIWFLFGTMTADPKFLDFINDNCASFQRIGMITQEVAPQPAGDPAVTWITNPSAGYLKGDIDAFRKCLRGRFLNSLPSPPLISLYASAKITQIWSTSSARLSLSIKSFSNIYQKAASDSSLDQPTARLLTIMGACMVDDLFATQVAGPGFEGSSEGRLVMQEFGFNPDTDSESKEWMTLKAFVQSDSFSTDAQTQLLSLPTWDCGCGERMLSYDNFKRAVN